MKTGQTPSTGQTLEHQHHVQLQNKHITYKPYRGFYTPKPTIVVPDDEVVIECTNSNYITTHRMPCRKTYNHYVDGGFEHRLGRVGVGHCHSVNPWCTHIVFVAGLMVQRV